MENTDRKTNIIGHKLPDDGFDRLYLYSDNKIDVIIKRQNKKIISVNLNTLDSRQLIDFLIEEKSYLLNRIKTENRGASSVYNQQISLIDSMIQSRYSSLTNSEVIELYNHRLLKKDKIIKDIHSQLKESLAKDKQMFVKKYSLSLFKNSLKYAHIKTLLLNAEKRINEAHYNKEHYKCRISAIFNRRLKDEYENILTLQSEALKNIERSVELDIDSNTESFLKKESYNIYSSSQYNFFREEFEAIKKIAQERGILQSAGSLISSRMRFPAVKT